MNRRRMAATAAALAVMAAAPVPSARGQSTGNCESPRRSLDEMTVQVGSPTGSEPRTDASVPIEVQVSNTSTRKQLPTDPDPLITKIRVTIVRCRDGQVLPDEVSRASTAAASRTMSFTWTPEPIPTNGPFVVTIVATGNRTGSPAQESVVDVPFSLAVPPRRPTEVKAGPTAKGAVVSWSNKDREPDLLFYEVQRAPQGSGSFVTIDGGIVDASTNTVDDRPGVGSWRYRVFAIRKGATNDTGIRSAASADATAEVVAPPPVEENSTATTTQSQSATTGSTAGASGGTTTTTTRAGSSGSTVNLSNFSAALNARRVTPPRRVEPSDPGFNETLPFTARPLAPEVDELGDDEAEPQELGTGEPNQGLGQRLISNEDERRRSLGFVAGGLLLFVLSMTGLFLKSEVRRADELDTMSPDPDPEPEPASEPEPRPETVPSMAGFEGAEPLVGVIPPPPRRARRTAAPVDAPSLDVGEPATVAPRRTRTRTTTAHARRTPPVLPSRPAGDRRQGGAAVRPRRRGAGEGDGRVPLG